MTPRPAYTSPCSRLDERISWWEIHWGSCRMGLSESFNFPIMLVVWWYSLNIQFKGILTSLLPLPTSSLFMFLTLYTLVISFLAWLLWTCHFETRELFPFCSLHTSLQTQVWKYKIKACSELLTLFNILLSWIFYYGIYIGRYFMYPDKLIKCVAAVYKYMFDLKTAHSSCIKTNISEMKGGLEHCFDGNF